MGNLTLCVLSCICVQFLPVSGDGGQCLQEVFTTQQLVRTPQMPDTTTHIVSLSDRKLVGSIKIDLNNCLGVHALGHTMNISVEYADLADVMLLKRTYEIHCVVAHGKKLSCDLPRPASVRELYIVTSNEIDCASIQLLGCAISSTICKNDICQNGGTCVAESKCVCRPGFFGLKCEFNIQDLQQFTSPVIGNSELDCRGPVERVTSLPAKLWKRFLMQNPSLTSSLPSGYFVFKRSDANCTSGVERSTETAMFRDFARIFRGRLHEKGFTHMCTIYFGANHHDNHVIYLYNTHHHFWNTSTHGASLTYSNRTLTFTVDDGRRAFFLQLDWLPKLQNQPNSVTSSYSPLYGLTLFANGVHLGSKATPERLHEAINGKAHLCFGSQCSDGRDMSEYRHQHGVRYALFDIKAFGASMNDLVLNGIANNFGLTTFGNSVTTPLHVASSQFTTRQTTTTTQSATTTPVTQSSSETTDTTIRDPQTTAMFTATALRLSTTLGHCMDSSACAPLVAMGEAVCADARLAHTDCRKSCNHCDDNSG